MGLRGRLVLFFVAITVVPMTVAVAVLAVQGDGARQRRATDELQRAGASAVAVLELTRQRAGDLTFELANRQVDARSPAEAQDWLQGQELAGRADVVVVARPDGTVLAARVVEPPPPGVAQDEAVRAMALAAVGQRPGPLPLLLAVTNVVGGPLGGIAAGVWLDAGLLDVLVSDPQAGTGAAFVVAGAVLAATGAGQPDPADLPAAGQVAGSAIAGEQVLLAVTAVPTEPAGGAAEAADGALVLWAPSPAGLNLLPTLLVLVVALLAAVPLGSVLAGSVIAPIRRAAEVARAVAAGDLSRKLTPTGGRELAELAVALNAMSGELGARLAEIERSHDELRKSVSRLGQALSSSLDLQKMLPVVVDTAVDMVRADGAVLMLLESDALVTKVDRFGRASARLAPDVGIAGHVIRTGRPLRLPGSAGVPPRAPGEPTAPYLLAVPLGPRDRPAGVLTLVREEVTGPFVDDDLETVASIAAGTTVAIENIRLHQETQRLSLTNPVTGLWNYRYFELQVTTALERARRFKEPVSVLAIDIDHFKRINDVYDHAAGNAALAEVGLRLREAATRAVDVVTHLHGEEFAVLLPDTDHDGALAVGERMRAAVAARPVRLPGAGPDGGPVDEPLTCSVGVATFPVHAGERDLLYRMADQAMKLGKQRGRNQVVSASDVVDSLRA
ncbi:MAG TPA: diguanylate cyclase [Egibacteraceae bacterium]|nr:diguanylate cyclase [Egibacteraceae bacterium]